MAIVNTTLTLKDLPTPPEGKTGWPWTEQTEPLPDKMPDGSEWPRISIVTPSYNQGQFIEETIRSVLLQGYPNIEYIIIDGGSNDNTLEIINKYDKYLTYWISERDKGQSDAINKGFKISTGKISAFLNSDDLYMPNALEFVSQYLIQNSQQDFICAKTKFIDSDSIPTKGFEELFMVEINHITMTEECHIAQPSTFFRSNVFQKIGFFNQEMKYCFDYEFWLRAFLSGLNFASSKKVISQFRLHTSSKTMSAYTRGEFDRDFISIYQSFLSDKGLIPLYKQGLRRGLGKASCLLFVHLEQSRNLKEARLTLWSIILENPDVLLIYSMWPTLVISITPVPLRIVWRKIKLIK
ncbi:MAG: glycosyltransferase family 2 protein [Nostoc sp.]|uniref:glycosyltransferase family 2 protein n=1 Tax=Nostoc sp. TaxID=1180 RepID=UPI002FF23937